MFVVARLTRPLPASEPNGDGIHSRTSVESASSPIKRSTYDGVSWEFKVV